MTAKLTRHEAAQKAARDRWARPGARKNVRMEQLDPDTARRVHRIVTHRRLHDRQAWRRRIALFAYRMGYWLGDRIDPWHGDCEWKP